jgi:hypothetical protein
MPAFPEMLIEKNKFPNLAPTDASYRVAQKAGKMLVENKKLLLLQNFSLSQI